LESQGEQSRSIRVVPMFGWGRAGAERLHKSNICCIFRPDPTARERQGSFLRVRYEHKTLPFSSLRPTVSLTTSAASIPLLATSSPHPPRPCALCSFPRFFLRSVQIYDQAASQAGARRPPRAQASAPATRSLSICCARFSRTTPSS
jgi:hypothetical protein